MAEKCLGVVVIGQAPRADAEAELRRVLGAAIGIELVGALDGLSRDDIERVVPESSGDTLFTILADGKPATLAQRLVEARAAAQLERLAARGLDVVLHYCTGEFPTLAGRRGIVFPSAVLTSFVTAVLPQGRLGVFTPLPAQVERIRDKWAESGLTVLVEPLLPVAGSEDIAAAATRMARHAPDLVVLDCMSYTQAMKEQVRLHCPARGVLAVSLAARAVQELLH